MSDFSETSTQGWFSRILSSIKGVVVGLVLVAAAFPFLWVNEGCAVRTAKGLAEGRGNVVLVASSPVNPANEAKLVHLQGNTVTKSGAHDTALGLNAPGAIRLQREVEMYQWIERQESKKEKNVGGAEETKTSYSYSKGWASSRNNSANFKLHIKDGESTDNPAMQYVGESFSAPDVSVGAYRLDSGLLSSISGGTPMPIAALPAGLAGRGHVAAGGVYVGADPGHPRVGDLRIKWTKTDPCTVTIIARQHGAVLDAWPTSQGTTINMLEKGILTPDQMFVSAEKSNVIRTWACRFGGLMIMMIGFSMIFKPLVVVADVVPFIGSIIGMGTGFVAFVLAAPLSLFTIAVAWIRFRPMIGIPLFLLGVALAVGAFVMAKKRKKA